MSEPVISAPTARPVLGLPSISQGEVERLWEDEVRFYALLGMTEPEDPQQLEQDRLQHGALVDEIRRENGGEAAYSWPSAARFLSATSGLPLGKTATYLYLCETQLAGEEAATEDAADECLQWARGFASEHGDGVARPARSAS